MKRDPLGSDQVYHVFSKSIAGFRIFRDDGDYLRMIHLMKYYRFEKPQIKFSAYLELKEKERFFATYCATKESLVDIICYCLMPTHLHLVLKQARDGGISVFMGNLLNSYSRYFNTRTGRKGPLWQSRFKHVEVASDEQLSHLTRYIHLNPVTDYLADEPAQWAYSSYGEYIGESMHPVCTSIFNMFGFSSDYIQFVSDQIEYQRSLAYLKHLVLE